MISAKLVNMIEDHAEQLTRDLLLDLQQNPRTTAYHQFPLDELHNRAYDVYRNLGQWLLGGSESTIESAYIDLGRRRFAEGIPLSQVVFALILTKNHLLHYVKAAELTGTALELYQELELNESVSQFFDKAICYMVHGYEDAAGMSHSGGWHGT